MAMACYSRGMARKGGTCCVFDRPHRPQGPSTSPGVGLKGTRRHYFEGLLWALSHVPCGAAGVSVGLGLCPVPGGLLCYYLNRDS